MKFSDLKVGESYYYDRSNDWATAKYRSATRAVLVDGDRYRINRSTWGYRETTYVKDPKGRAALVDIYHDGSDSPERRAVLTSHLRGPWEKTHAEVSERRRAIQESADAAKATAEDLRQRADSAAERAKRFGLKVRINRGWGAQKPKVEMSVAEFERLVEMIADAAKREGFQPWGGSQVRRTP